MKVLGKENYFEKDYQKLKQKYEEIYEIKEQYRKQIENYQVELLEEKELLTKIQRYINKLEVQNEYLSRENREYQKKINLIKESCVGKIAVKGYHLLKKILK